MILLMLGLFSGTLGCLFMAYCAVVIAKTYQRGEIISPRTAVISAWMSVNNFGLAILCEHLLKVPLPF